MMYQALSEKKFSDVAHLPAYNDLLPCIVDMITSLVAQHDKLPRSELRTVFDGSKPAVISINDYIIRLVKYGCCSKQVFICMVIYLDRLASTQKLQICSYNIHRLLLACFVVAAKLQDDIYYSNKFYASIGGVYLQDLNKMEAKLLEGLKWNLMITKEHYESVVAMLKEHSKTLKSAHTQKPSLKAPVVAVEPEEVVCEDDTFDASRKATCTPCYEEVNPPTDDAGASIQW